MTAKATLRNNILAQVALSFILLTQVMCEAKAYELSNYNGIEIRMHDVELCPSCETLLKKEDGFLCYSKATLADKAISEHGCLRRRIYPSGRGDVLRTGFWFSWNEFRQAIQVSLYGENETKIGSQLLYNNDGFIEIGAGEQATGFILSCRIK